MTNKHENGNIVK